MTIDNVIESVKPLINYDFNPAIRETLFPFDKFVKSALESALNAINSKCRIIEKTIFVPLVQNTTQYLVDLSNFTKSKFVINSPKSMFIVRSDGQISKFPNKFLENILHQDYYTDTFAAAFRHIANMNYIVMNTNITESVSTVGTYHSITSVTDTNTIVIDPATSAGMFVINLEKAPYYSYRIVSSGTTTIDFTTDGIKSFPIWESGDKLYVCSTLPYMFCLTFQGSLQPGYFDTETTIPAPDAYLNGLPDLVVKYLYQVLAIRFPDQAKVYMQMLQTKLIASEDEVIWDIKTLINSSIESPVIKAYNPYTEYYGR